MVKDPKDVIYIDIDDEITAIIDKLQGSQKKIVALVLPKRAPVLQSIVNMKLLKRTAQASKKNLVLITSESALMPLAGAVGVHVAKTPQSKPEIPPAPATAEAAAYTNGSNADTDKQLDRTASVGSLAGLPDDLPIEVDNSDASDDKKAKASPRGKSGKKGKDAADKKKFKIPNFEKFRSKLLWGGLAAVLLIAGLIAALFVLPKATITLRTDTSNLNTSFSFIADPAAGQADLENAILPAIQKEYRNTDTEKVKATGEKNKGDKATGSILLTNCSSSTGSLNISSGTGVSVDNLTYITNNTVTLPESSFNANGDCKTQAVQVNVTAREPGEKYNVSPGRNFTVAGYSSVDATNDSDIDGGSDEMVKVVTQDDIDKAKSAIEDRASSEAPDDLKRDITSEGYYPIEESLNAGEPTVTSTAEADDEAEEVTVTSTTVFTMLGVKEEDLGNLIAEQAKQEIDPETQVIRDNGLNDASINIEQISQEGRATIGIQTIVVAGPEIDEAGIKELAKGKKAGEIEDTLKQRPGVREVQIKYSPFWVSTTPKSEDKITLVVDGNDTEDNEATSQ